MRYLITAFLTFSLSLKFYYSDIFTEVEIFYWKHFKFIYLFFLFYYFFFFDVFLKDKALQPKSDCFFTNLAVNKDIKWKRKFCRQSFSKYFETVWCFTKFSFHYKWNYAGLLILKMLWTSSLTSCWTTEDLGSYKIIIFDESA